MRLRVLRVSVVDLIGNSRPENVHTCDTGEAFVSIVEAKLNPANSKSEFQN